MSDLDRIRTILELARWAPSGDNTQPWRFEIVSASHVVVHGFDTRSYCVYDLDGHSSQLALGALLESMKIAASAHALDTAVTRRGDMPDTRPTFDVLFRTAPGMSPNGLLECLPKRSVQRRPLKTRPLTARERQALEGCLGPAYRVSWLEGAHNRWRAARLLWRNAKLRLTLPEAYEVHRSIIEWNARFSDDRIPERALGASWPTARVMRFAMQRWSRVAFLNRWLAGTVLPRVELDLVPALSCGAHFLICAQAPCRSVDDYVAAGAAMQRFWLTATSLQLQLQPEMTPLIFARYAAAGHTFSRALHAQPEAHAIAAGLGSLFGTEAAAQGVFMGRIGAGQPAEARSLRLPMERLIITAAP